MQIKVCGEINDEMNNKKIADFFTILYVNFDIEIKRRKRFGEASFEAILDENICFFGIAGGSAGGVAGEVAGEVIDSEFDLDLMLHLLPVLFKRYFNA